MIKCFFRHDYYLEREREREREREGRHAKANEAFFSSPQRVSTKNADRTGEKVLPWVINQKIF